jgi:hypothetical protein
VKVGNRVGDNAPISMIELVDRVEKEKETKTKKSKKKAAEKEA